MKEVFIKTMNFNALLTSSKVIKRAEKTTDCKDAFSDVNPFVQNTLKLLMDRHVEMNLSCNVQMSLLNWRMKKKAVADAMFTSVRP